MPFGWGALMPVARRQTMPPRLALRLQCLSAGGGFDAKIPRGSMLDEIIWSPMPFGWGGFDAAPPALECQFTLGCLQCLSAGGALMPLCRNCLVAGALIASPMPFGWGGFDALSIIWLAAFRASSLQCLSAGGALMPTRCKLELRLRPRSLQCLSAGGALMPAGEHPQ